MYFPKRFVFVMLAFLLASPGSTDAGICDMICYSSVAICYVAAGVTFGGVMTVAAVAGVPTAVMGCNQAYSVCSKWCE